MTFFRQFMLKPSLDVIDPAVGGGGGVEDKTKTAPEKKSFSQEELDFLFTKRANTARTERDAEVMKLLGVENLDQAKAILEKQRLADEAGKSELEKTQSDLKTLQTELEKAKAEHDQILAEAREQRLQAEVLKETISYKDANGLGFRPEAINDVWTVLDKTAIKDGEKGTFAGIKEVVAQLAKDRPHWLADGKQQTSTKGTPPGAKQKPAANEQRQENQRPAKPFTL
jgi:hypothetical protein